MIQFQVMLVPVPLDFRLRHIRFRAFEAVRGFVRDLQILTIYDSPIAVNGHLVA